MSDYREEYQSNSNQSNDNIIIFDKVFKLYEDLNVLASEASAKEDIHFEHLLGEEVIEEIEDISSERIKSDAFLREELAIKLGSKLTASLTASLDLSDQWFLTEPFPIKEAIEAINIDNKIIARRHLVGSLETYLGGPLTYMSTETHLNRKEALEFAYTNYGHQLYTFGRDLYDTYCTGRCPTTGKAIKAILNRPLNQGKSDLSDLSGHTLALLSELPAYRHDNKKRLSCNLCKHKSYTYCVQCTFFHGFPEVTTVCEKCRKEHKLIGFITPAVVTRKRKRSKIESVEEVKAI